MNSGRGALVSSQGFLLELWMGQAPQQREPEADSLLASATRQENETEDVHIVYEEIKLFLFADDRIVHIEVLKESTNELLELMIVNLARLLYTTVNI